MHDLRPAEWYESDPGESILSLDFGYRSDGMLGDTIWLDLNGDGVYGVDEVGIENVEVDLTLQGGQIFSTIHG